MCLEARPTSIIPSWANLDEVMDLLVFRRLALAIQQKQWFGKFAGTSRSMWTSRIQKCREVFEFSRQPCKCRLHNLRKSSLQGGEITVDEYTRLINVLNPMSGYTLKDVIVNLHLHPVYKDGGADDFFEGGKKLRVHCAGRMIRSIEIWFSTTTGACSKHLINLCVAT